MTVRELAKRYPTAAEYISEIYLIIRDYTYCNNSRLAGHIGVSPSAVSQSISRLKKLGLTQQDRYGMITLSDEGIALAEEILKRHYLLEYLMVRELNYPWDLADREAESLQAQISNQFLDHLYERLGRPDRCPHGNPMPGNRKCDEILSAIGLDQAEVGDKVEIVRITEEGERVEGLLHLCYINQVMPESRYTIEEKSDESILMTNAQWNSITIPAEYTPFIRMKKL